MPRKSKAKRAQWALGKKKEPVQVDTHRGVHRHTKRAQSTLPNWQLEVLSDRVIIAWGSRRRWVAVMVVAVDGSHSIAIQTVHSSRGVTNSDTSTHFMTVSNHTHTAHTVGRDWIHWDYPTARQKQWSIALGVLIIIAQHCHDMPSDHLNLLVERFSLHH